MSSPLRLLLLLLLLFAVASPGPLDSSSEEGTSLPATAITLTSPSLAASAASAASNAAKEERAVPAATLAPPADGQYCTVAGAVFHNGARLPASADPDPCRACYCQGGESVCTRVHCYRRPDCAPRHVPGSCCPKYDNCPPAPEERLPEPRVKDVSTQTDYSVEPTATPTTDAARTTAATTPVTATDTWPTSEQAAESTETTAAGTATVTTATDFTTVTMATTTTAATAAGTASTLAAEEDEEAADSATSSYPPGIDLHALHEHLPFLSPGDANGPNT